MRKKRVASELKFASSSTPTNFAKIRTTQIKPAVRYLVICVKLFALVNACI